MPELNDITNSFIKDEIDEFIERNDERFHLIEAFSQADPRLQDISAALIDGDNTTVDKLTKEALDVGFEALEIMDNGLIIAMSIVGI